MYRTGLFEASLWIVKSARQIGPVPKGAVIISGGGGADNGPLAIA
jgi:hypothetical protein